MPGVAGVAPLGPGGAHRPIGEIHGYFVDLLAFGLYVL